MLTADPRAHITYLRATVAEELAFGLEQRGIAPAQMWERVRKIGLGLENLLDRAPAQLSGGQTRRLAIGAVAILEAPTMLLDDPFSGLDTSSRAQLITMLESYEGDVIVAAHKPWLDVPTAYLGDLEELSLPARVEFSAGNNADAGGNSTNLNHSFRSAPWILLFLQVKCCGCRGPTVQGNPHSCAVLPMNPALN